MEELDSIKNSSKNDIWNLTFTPSQMGEKPLGTSGHLGKVQDRQQPRNEVCFG